MKKALWLVLVPLLVLGLLLAAGTTAVVMLATTTLSQSDAECDPGRVDAPISSGSILAEQLRNAQIIDDAARAAGLSGQATYIALTVAVGESDLININYGDTAGPDSRGVFQQRPSQGWGTEAQVMDVKHAAKSFLLGPRHDGKAGLVAVPGWQNMTVTAAGHAVQNNLDPLHYARFEPRARDIASRGQLDLNRPGQGSTNSPSSQPGWIDPCGGGFAIGTGPCPLDVPGQKVTCQHALEFAQQQMRNGSREWHQWCLKFVSTAYGGVFPQGTAYLAALDVQSHGLMRADRRDIPRGAVLWWDGNAVGNPAGHVAIYAGNGMVISTDAPINDGRVGLVPMSTLDAWGQRFMGWSPPRHTTT